MGSFTWPSSFMLLLKFMDSSLSSPPGNAGEAKSWLSCSFESRQRCKICVFALARAEEEHSRTLQKIVPDAITSVRFFGLLAPE